jgi:hypothetical protein
VLLNGFLIKITIDLPDEIATEERDTEFKTERTCSLAV